MPGYALAIGALAALTLPGTAAAIALRRLADIR